MVKNTSCCQYCTLFPWHRISLGVFGCDYNAVEAPNKGRVGDNINSTVVSFVERLSSFILCHYRGGSTIGGSTVTHLKQ